jgi:hypothetical protein
MDDIESLYKKVDGMVMLEIKLSSIMQLFNSFDPAPFHEKELDSAAEEYIVDAVEDFPAKTLFKMIIYLPPELVGTDQAKKIAPAIHNHFRYKMLVADRRFRSRFREGRMSLFIGLSFLSINLIARQLIFISNLANLFLAQLLTDALLVFGWAAMWEPITILLYELRPIVRKKNVYRRISEMDIGIEPLYHPALNKTVDFFED